MAVLVCLTGTVGRGNSSLEPRNEKLQTLGGPNRKHNNTRHVLTGRLVVIFSKGGTISRVFLRVGTQGSVEEVFFVICCCVSTPVIVSSLLQISVVLGLHFNVVIATSTSVSHGASLVIVSLASFLISCFFLIVCETVSQTVTLTDFLRCSRSGQSQLERC